MAAVVFALDQATKFLVLQYIPEEGESWSLLTGLDRIFKLTHITNSGAAFGSFSEMGDVFKIVAIVIIVAIILFYHHLPTEVVWVRVSLGLQLGGAMGNLLDRFLHPDGAVVDFIDIGFWPIFNLADLSIVVGVSILAYYLWNEENQEGGEMLQEGGKL